jgi:hypothetical protein
MKRKQRETPNRSNAKTRAIEMNRLAGVRGGSDLGIAVETVGPPPPIMTQQHNETLVGW